MRNMYMISVFVEQITGVVIFSSYLRIFYIAKNSSLLEIKISPWLNECSAFCDTVPESSDGGVHCI